MSCIFRDGGVVVWWLWEVGGGGGGISGIVVGAGGVGAFVDIDVSGGGARDRGVGARDRGVGAGVS